MCWRRRAEDCSWSYRFPDEQSLLSPLRICDISEDPTMIHKIWKQLLEGTIWHRGTVDDPFVLLAKEWYPSSLSLLWSQRASNKRERGMMQTRKRHHFVGSKGACSRFSYQNRNRSYVFFFSLFSGTKSYLSTKVNLLKKVQAVTQFNVFFAQTAAGHSAERLSARQKQTPAALLLAEVVDTAEVPLCFFMAQFGWRLRYTLKLSYYITHVLYRSL